MTKGASYVEDFFLQVGLKWLGSWDLTWGPSSSRSHLPLGWWQQHSVLSYFQSLLDYVPSGSESWVGSLHTLTCCKYLCRFCAWPGFLSAEDCGWAMANRQTGADPATRQDFGVSPNDHHPLLKSALLITTPLQPLGSGSYKLSLLSCCGHQIWISPSSHGI